MCQDNPGPLSIYELSGLMNLEPEFLEALVLREHLPGAYFDHGRMGTFFDRDEIIPWLLTEEAEGIYDSYPEHHVTSLWRWGDPSYC